MRKRRRSAERLSYWLELGSQALTRREKQMPRSFAVNNKWFPMAAEVMVSLTLVLLLTLTWSTKLQAQGPALTTISDTVYRADGSAASGTVLISWPSFQTAQGDAVAAGNLAVTIGPLGAFTAQLVPNVGASPAGTYYVVVLQLDDGTVRTEYWAVPVTSPTTIAAVLTTPGTGLGNLAVTQGYVDAAVANRAIDATVVHLAGTETITGTKQFAVPPALPAPAGANDAANKSYVDAAVANVGSGAYVPIAGGTMTGPLTLPAEPGRMTLAEDRLIALEKNDIRRTTYDRIVIAAITFAITFAIGAIIAWYKRPVYSESRLGRPLGIVGRFGEIPRAKAECRVGGTNSHTYWL
jgi:hypothetical protein